jgi:hypothetical protein
MDYEVLEQRFERFQRLVDVKKIAPPQSPVYRVPNEEALLITLKNIRMIHQTKEELNKVQSIGQEFRTGIAKLVKKTEEVMAENAILEQDLAGYGEAKKDAQNVVKRRRI